MYRNLLMALLVFLAFAVSSAVAIAEVTPEEEFVRDTKDFNYSQVENAISLAKKYLRLERFDFAEQILDKTLETKPNDFYFYKFYGDLLIRLTKEAKAIDVLEACRSKKITSYDVEYMLGDLYFRSQNFSRAARSFEKAASINHIYVEPLFYWGLATTYLGLESDPVKAFKGIEQLFPTSPYAPIGWGIYHYFRGDFDSALAEFAKLTGRDDLPAIYYLSVCSLNIQLGKFPEADAALKQSIKVDPLYPGILTNTAILALFTKKDPEIAKAIETANKHESFVELKMAQAYFLIKTNKETDAENLLRQIITDNSKQYYANYLLGVIYTARIERTLQDKTLRTPVDINKAIKDDADNAINYLKACSTYGKDFFAGYFLLGKVYFARMEFKEALEEFGKAAKLAPYNVAVQKYIGHCYISLSKWSDAKRTFDALLQRDDKDPHVLDCLGYIVAVTGNIPEATKYFETALAIDPRDKYAKDQIKALEDLEKKMRTGKP